MVFCRCDYGVNKNVFNRHGIWVQDPDGTGMDLFFGNTIIDPFGLYRPRQVSWLAAFKAVAACPP